MMNPLALIILCTLVVVMPVSNCRIIHPNDANLIEKTCKQTPLYDLCVQYLKADPRSSEANVTGLAQIMAGIMQTKAEDAIEGIGKLVLKGSPQKELLDSCFYRYKAILEADVPQTIAALQKGYPKFAESSAYFAAGEVTICEYYFSGKSPITYYNNATRDAAVLTGAIIVGQLLK